VLRLATWNADLGRDGPGLLVEDIAEGAPQIAAVVQGVVALDADVLLLTGINHDARLVAVSVLADRLAEAGAPYPYRFARPSNSGLPSGFDLNHDGRMGGPRDALGYGRFLGEEGVALLSRLPIRSDTAQDYAAFLWADLPGALLPPDLTGAEAAVQRLHSSSAWQVAVELPGGGDLALMAYSATPPVFDGPEDRNGRRNHDESAFWLRLLDGSLPFAPPKAPFVLLGEAGLDPADGEGRPAALRALLADPRLQDPRPQNDSGHHDPGHRGDPRLDTVLYPDGPGGMRVDYILPSADLKVAGAGVLWPAQGPLADTLARAARHRPVWVDLDLP